MKLFLNCARCTIGFALWALLVSNGHTQSSTTTVASSSELEIVSDTPHTFAAARLDTDTFTGRLTLNVAAEDVGRPADLYAVARRDQQWFIKTPTRWQSWDEQRASLMPFESTTLQATTTMDLFASEPLLAGDYEVFAAYQVNDEPLVLSPTPMPFTIESAQADTLHRFASPAAMEAYLKQGMQNTTTDQDYITRLETFATTASTDSSTSASVSTTNVQVAGVDEADTIKSDGNYLYALRNCVSETCVATFSLNPAQAEAEELGVYVPESTDDSSPFNTAQSMYFVDKPGSDEDTLVTLSGQNRYITWFSIWGWSNNQTRLEFLNASDPANLQLTQSLTLDGSLVASRRVGDTLYLVTRYTPTLPDFIPYALDKESQQSNADLLATSTLSDLVPRMWFPDKSSLELVEAESCYLATSAVDKSQNPSMITITALPLDNPADFKSTCYLGNSETLYMTTESLFLATTQYNYSLLAADALVYDPEHRTAVHKFSLTGTGVDYRGSGEVRGHLGWSEDKRSFRMGANGTDDEYLNIVTSIGDTWGGNSSTRLTVLKENGNELEPIKIIDGIGKPGEQLYAARFVGDRAYLVTFRVIDPLYVVDLSDQENPFIAGELEIDGYSDYLHPISETLLLGIGKDAIADDGSTDFGFQRGAWYQGVKLSLFDVADPANPTEINSLIYGKRGTHSEILNDHHAISFLPATENRPARFAIPIQLHTTEPDYEHFDASQPNAYYSFTSRGLYSFEVNSSGVQEVGYIEAESADGSLRYYPWGSFGDRSVLVDDAVFYVHEGELLSAPWGTDLP